MRTPASTGLAAASLSNWSRAATSASRPTPPRSCSRSEKPAELPSAGIGGGFSGNTMASRMVPMNAPKARRASASAASARSCQSLSVTNAMPAFWPLPEKLKPVTATTFCTAGCLAKKPSTWVSTCAVRLALAPAGSSTLVSRNAWSSAGRNEVGSRMYIRPTTATMTP